MFPKSVDIYKIAFAFEHPLEHSILEQQCYIKDLAEIVKIWRCLYYSKNRPYLFFAKGTDFVEIWDSRNGTMERIILSRASASVFLYCESIKNTRQIFNHIDSYFPSQYTESQKQDILSRLLVEKLLFKEGDSFLTLAIPQSCIYDELRYVSETEYEVQRSAKI
jgi:hypothetical protein